MALSGKPSIFASARRLKKLTLVAPLTFRRPATASHSATMPRVSIGNAV